MKFASLVSDKALLTLRRSKCILEAEVEKRCYQDDRYLANIHGHKVAKSVNTSS